MIGLIVLGLFIKLGLESFSDKDRKVTVKGLSEREVQADKVTWPIMTKELGDDLPSLYTRINATTAKVKSFLKQNGIKDSEISINAPVVVDMNAERYGVQNHDYRYNITSTITVVVDGGYGNGVVYEYVSFQQMKPKMMQEAIKNAEQTAKQFAENSDSKIDKILTAGQGQFSIENRDNNTPYIKKLRVVTTVTYSLKD